MNGVIQESEKKLEEMKSSYLSKVKEKDDQLKKLKDQMKLDENERIASQLAWKETKQHLIDQLTTLTVGTCAFFLFEKHKTQE